MDHGRGGEAAGAVGQRFVLECKGRETAHGEVKREAVL